VKQTVNLGCVDRVLELTDTSIRVQKGLTINEDYLLDHFPEYPVLPGVLMIQTAFEASSLWLKETRNVSAGSIKLKEIKNARFSRFLFPGEILKVEVTWKGNEENPVFLAKGQCEENVVFSLQFTVNYA